MTDKNLSNKLLLKPFNFKLLISLIVGFATTLIIGVQIHTIGHYAIAKAIDRNSTLYWGTYGTPCDSENRNFRKLCYEKYAYEIEHNLDFPYKNVFDYINLKSEEKWSWVKYGGPIITMIIGSLGFGLLLFYRKKMIANHPNISLKYWIFIFASLFWLERTIYALVDLAFYTFNGRPFRNCDRYDTEYGLLPLSIEVLTGLIGIAVLLALVFHFIPKNKRLTFIIAGCIGPIMGALLWYLFFIPDYSNL